MNLFYERKNCQTMLIPEDEMPEDENLTHILSEAEEPTFF